MCALFDGCHCKRAGSDVAAYTEGKLALLNGQCRECSFDFLLEYGKSLRNLGMDRTGVTAMLLLGLVGASKERIVSDYCYSFASEREVDRYVYEGICDGARRELSLRYEAIDTVYDRLVLGYGSVPAYLESCGVTNTELDSVCRHLCAPQP